MLRLVGLTALGIAATLVAPGFLLEGPREELEPSDAIIVISGDEAMARFREGVRLYRAGWAPRLIFSGAARHEGESNAAMMRRMAVGEGVAPAAILTEPAGEDTLGNAVFSRALMETHGLRSAILVTSPYHLHRASLTFEGVFREAGIRVIGRPAPDGAWRKISWWTRPDTRELTMRELEKLGYIAITGRFN
jgi:uncharacterized SAM-binding protein YcdF (DUF218 family)